MFCPRCGSILTPKKEGTKKVLACSCGYKDSDLDSAVIKESIAKKKEIEIIERDDDKSLPICDADCPKCKTEKAYYWTLQTRAGDEPETKFLKCTKCKHTWRDYS